MWDFFETVPFHRMAPRPDLVDSGFCLVEPGREYLIYLESRGAMSAKAEGGPFRAEWINAQDTKDRRPGGTERDGKDVTSPAAGDDWLLRLVKDTKQPK